VGIDSSRLSFAVSDVYDVRPEVHGTFDVVLLLGLIYHVEDPVGAIRRARSLLKPGGICVVESQLTRQREPIVHGWGTAHQTETAEASFAVRVESDSAINPVASVEGIVSLVPNAAALEQITRAVGFGHVEWTTGRPGHDAQYVEGDRAVIWAR
jgi:SAM-dependent methyltransferase